MAKENEAEKIVKDSLRWKKQHNEIIHYENNVKPKYMREIIDFYVWDNSGHSHLVEVKQRGSSKSIHVNQFEDDQIDLLTDKRMNYHHTSSWVVCRFFHGEKTRRSSKYYDYYFIFRGYRLKNHENITLNNMKNDQRFVMIANWDDGEYRGMSDEYGLTTEDNKTRGIKNFDVF